MENVYGDSFTAIAATASTTFYPSDDVGGTTSTAASSVLADAKTVVIKSINIATFTASTNAFTLADHAGNTISTFTPNSSATVNRWTFGPNGIRINSGWRITQGSTASALIVVWKKLA